VYSCACTCVWAVLVGSAAACVLYRCLAKCVINSCELFPLLCVVAYSSLCTLTIYDCGDKHRGCRHDNVVYVYGFGGLQRLCGLQRLLIHSCALAELLWFSWYVCTVRQCPGFGKKIPKYLGLARIVYTYTPYMTVCLVISCQKCRIYTVYIWLYATLYIPLFWWCWRPIQYVAHNPNLHRTSV